MGRSLSVSVGQSLWVVMGGLLWISQSIARVLLIQGFEYVTCSWCIYWQRGGYVCTNTYHCGYIYIQTA